MYVEEGDVISCFSRLNPSKASGPDGLKGRVLKVCAPQLGPVPVSKKPNVKQMNDFRPVALTSILAKCMERIVCNQMVASVADRMDSLPTRPEGC